MLLRYTVMRRLIVYRKLLICDKERKKSHPSKIASFWTPAPPSPLNFRCPPWGGGGGMDIIWNYTI